MQDKEKIIIKPMGDCAISLKFSEDINIQTHFKIQSLAQYLDNNPFKGMIEYVPSFISLTIFYDPLEVISLKKDKNQTPFNIVKIKIEKILDKLSNKSCNNSRIVEIPVCYGEEFGLDLKIVAKYNNLSIEEVINIHSSYENRVYMIGFAPGFPYLAGMSDKIATPRKKTPRLSIPAGSVGIAGAQTGVYPISTPGGWQLIGRTPLDLFNPENEIPSLLKAGDIVKFKSISKAEYYEIKYEKEQGILKWA
ncbi:conserved hypothetical protein [Clostridium botulinum C str. Eklund]|nr:conserved hypothetical protein [Clostridium botulinum C str. Eklund]NEZ49135.1 5-oxoprolinase subunit PxpB [Clostridium botulinum]